MSDNFININEVKKKELTVEEQLEQAKNEIEELEESLYLKELRLKNLRRIIIVLMVMIGALIVFEWIISQKYNIDFLDLLFWFQIALEVILVFIYDYLLKD